jgi:hypothetical protein
VPSLNLDSSDQQNNDVSLAVLTALIGNVGETSDNLIAIHQEDALFWKERYVALATKLTGYVKSGSIGELIGILDEASFYGELAGDEINRSVSIS